MFTRSKTLAAAVLGVILLSVTTAGPAHAEMDAVLITPKSVELPATIVIASSSPTMSIYFCYQGESSPKGDSEGIYERCDPYPVGRMGPDVHGRYHFLWKLPMGAVGNTVIQIGRYEGSRDAFVTFTVTDSRLEYGDFQSCSRNVRGVHTNAGRLLTIQKAYVAYYARMDTTLVFKLQRFVKPRGKRARWVTVREGPQDLLVERPQFGAPYLYARRISKPFTLFAEQLSPRTRSAPRYRLIYEVTQGRKVLTRRRVSSQSCRWDNSFVP